MKFLPLVVRNVSDKHKAQALNSFLSTGASRHSVVGLMASYILNFCIEERIPFRLSYLPDGGYSIQRLDPRTMEPIA